MPVGFALRHCTPGYGSEPVNGDKSGGKGPVGGLLQEPRRARCHTLGKVAATETQSGGHTGRTLAISRLHTEDGDSCLRRPSQEVRELRSGFVGQRNESRVGKVELDALSGQQNEI